MIGFAGCRHLSSSSGQQSAPANNSRRRSTSRSIRRRLQGRAEAAHLGRSRLPAPIWVAGYWDYLDGNYIWRDSRWVQGKPDYEYVRARYEYDGQAWTFHRPHWKRRQKTTESAAAPKQ